MTRLALALTGFLCCLSPAVASLAPRTAPPADDNLIPSLGKTVSQDKPLPPELVRAASPRDGNPEYRMTSRTEITLDGRRCCYEEVPASAVILKMEVDSDNGTIVTIQFRTKK